MVKVDSLITLHQNGRIGISVITIKLINKVRNRLG